MRDVTRLAVAALLLCGLSAPAAAQRPAYKREVPPRLLRQTRVSEDSALKVAQARVPAGKVRALELENEGGALIWSFDFFVPSLKGTYEVHVDARTGALVGRVEHEMPAAAHDSGAAPKPRP